MNLDKRQSIAIFCWLLVFPGFIIYQGLVLLGYVPSFLGGFFTASITLSMVLLLPFWIRDAVRYWRRLPRLLHLPIVEVMPVVFWLYILIFLTVVVIGATSGVEPEITHPLFAYILKFIGLYILSLSVPLFSNRFIRMNLAAFLLLSLWIVLNSHAGSYLIHKYNPMDEDTQFDYQGLGLSFSLVALFAIYSVRNEFFRWLLWALALTCLFLIGARSEFVGFVLAVAVIEFQYANNPVKAIRLLFLCILLGFFGFVHFMVPGQEVGSGRMLGLLDLSSDQSAIERREMYQDALGVVAENPVFGQFAAYEPGRYAHNIVSAWADFGLIGLMILCALLASPFVFYVVARVRRIKPTLSLLIGISSMCLFLVLVAKTYFYQLIPISFGLFVNLASMKCPR